MHDGPYHVVSREDHYVLFSGTLADCYAMIDGGKYLMILSDDELEISNRSAASGGMVNNNTEEEQ